MQNSRFSFVLFCLLLAQAMFAWDDSPVSTHYISASSGAAATAYTSMLAKADIALARSIVSGNWPTSPYALSAKAKCTIKANGDRLPRS